MQRRSIPGLIALALALACPLAVQAQAAFPSKQIRIVVPYPAGGASDFVARLVGERLAKSLGQPVVVDNKAGASGALGVGEVAKSAPDGYTIALTLGDSIINNVALFKSLPYDPQRDLTFLTQAVFSPAIVTANPDLPVRNLGEFAKLASQQKGKLSFGSWGIGGLGHIAGEALSQRLGADMIHVPQRGESLVMQDLLAKSVSIGFTSAGLARQHVQAGKVTPLAILGKERSKVLPNVPTMREQGFEDPIFDAAVWIAFVGPAKMPPAVSKRLVDEIRAILAQPEVAAAIMDRGLEVMATTPEQFQANYRAEYDVIMKKIRDIGIQAQ
jgi:tripartite-type tricarboxylate transporter receptor subunit TctC